MKNILIAIDGSPAAAAAVTVGVDLAADQSSAVTFVHVLPASVALSAREDGPALQAAVRRARAVDVPAEIVTVSGDAAEEIVAYADTIDADMIVVGSRGRAAKGLLLGSVSSGVLHEARRPVLVVPRPPNHH